MTKQDKRRILITGANGMLGRTLCRMLNDYEIIATTHEDLDITVQDAVESVLKEVQPDAVIHCAAMTAVDDCEYKKDLAYLVNAIGSRNVAASCRRHDARLIAVSTDYVFNGDSDYPYSEFDVADGGKTIYGKSKFAGELAIREECPDHVIARVSWLYGSGGPSFIHTMRRLAESRKYSFLKIVNDQIGNPTSTESVAKCLIEILNRPLLTGTFHVTCEGEASWFDLAQKFFELSGITQKIIPCTSSEYPRPAPRPSNSRLDKQMLRIHGITPMPHWEVALKNFILQEWPDHLQSRG